MKEENGVCYENFYNLYNWIIIIIIILIIIIIIININIILNKNISF